MVNGQTQARHNAQMLGDITSVGSVPCAPASKFAFSLVQGGAIKPVRQKTPLEIILRAEELRNLPGLFETGAAAGPYTSRWSQAIGILHFGAVSTSFAITSLCSPSGIYLCIAPGSWQCRCLNTEEAFPSAVSERMTNCFPPCLPSQSTP